MKKLVMAVLVGLVVLATGPIMVWAQTPSGSGGAGSPWTLQSSVPQPRAKDKVAYLHPTHAQPSTLDVTALSAQLDAVPAEPSAGATPPGGGTVLSLPAPDGSMARFRAFESPIMAPELAAQFPEIRTFAGQGVDDPAATIRFDLTPQGFHAQVLSPNGAWYIDPYYHLDPSTYISYFRKDRGPNPHGDFVEGEIRRDVDAQAGDVPPPTANRSGTNLRVYRAAFAADGEYTAFQGGTVALGQAAIVTALNRVNGIYEREVAVRMVLVANNSSIVYTNAATDPYANTTADINTNQTNLDAVIGTANYDIGHVFTTGSGGLAGLGVVGLAGQKARGTTGTSSPTGDPFTVDYVAHEVGHQYGGNHTFNGVNGSCAGGNRNGSTAYEPGSGSTIQAYAGICGLDDLQLVGNGATGASDPYFHSVSFDEIVAYTTSGVGNIGATPTGNTVPTASAGADGAIPASTPFLLEGSGTDANGDTLSYQWEQRNLGAARALNNPEITAGPLFRSFVPTTSPVRYFPKLATIAAGGTNVPGPCPALTTTMGAAQACWSEFIPTAARTMNFRFTVRDNRAGGGGVNTDDSVVTVTNTGAPFAVTSQPAGTSYVGGSTQTVTWNVSGTTAAPISAPNVTILLSTDGGQTFPTTVLADTPNDGSQAVTIPNTATTQARIMVVRSGTGTGVRFFNVSPANFTITAGVVNSLSGTVKDSGGVGIKGVAVRVPGYPDVVTNAAGAYTVSGLAAGTYNVQAEGVCRAPVTQSKAISGASTLNFTLGAFGGCQVDTQAWDTTSSVLPLTGDDASTTVTLPFTYRFAGVDYTTAYISTNGVVNFLGPDTTYTNTAIPNAVTPNAAIYGFWDDLSVDGSSSVLANTFGTAPNRRYVIEWRNVNFIEDTSKRLSFQVVLYENTSERVRLQYKDIAFGTIETGSSATVGRENAAGNGGTQVLFDNDLLFDGLSVRPK